MKVSKPIRIILSAILCLLILTGFGLFVKKVGADIAANDDEGLPYDALDAAQRGDTATFVRLMQKGADVDLNIPEEHHGHTCLMEAAYYGHKEIVQALLKAGISADEQDEKGETVLQLAKAGRHPDIVALLKKAGATK